MRGRVSENLGKARRSLGKLGEAQRILEKLGESWRSSEKLGEGDKKLTKRLYWWGRLQNAPT